MVSPAVVDLGNLKIYFEASFEIQAKERVI
jgi:hypothetical protein